MESRVCRQDLFGVQIKISETAQRRVWARARNILILGRIRMFRARGQATAISRFALI